MMDRCGCNYQGRSIEFTSHNGRCTTCQKKQFPGPPDTDWNAAFEVRDWACWSSEFAVLRFLDALTRVVGNRVAKLLTPWQVIRYMTAADICDAALKVQAPPTAGQEAQNAE